MGSGAGEPLVIRPERLRQFGPPDGVTFCLVTTASVVADLDVQPGGGYREYRTIVAAIDEDFADVIAATPEPSHILVVSPDKLFRSPDDDVIGPRRKLLAMACNSTPTSVSTLRHFLPAIEATDPEEQERFAERFIGLAEASRYLRFTDPQHGTVMRLDHLADELEWNQQGGLLGWGEQQMVPSGEISVLPMDVMGFSEDLSLPLAGELCIRGYPILHNGVTPFSRRDQHRLHTKLDALRSNRVVATVEGGAVVALRALDDDAQPVVALLEAMFEVDSRYRKIWEIGFGFNTSVTLLAGNHAMNEVYGATSGSVHFGLGLTPYTQYHLDIVCPDIRVLTDAGEIVMGGDGAPDRFVAASPGPETPLAVPA